MALIPRFYLDCVVAIGVPKEESDQHEEQWIASGFLLGKFIEKTDQDHDTYRVYLVTNRHVLEGHKAVLLRFNPQDPQSVRDYVLQLVDGDGKRLSYCPADPDIDVAVVPINAQRLREHRMQFGFFHTDAHVANRAKLSKLGIAEGDFVYVLGFPMGLIGGHRSYAIARTGIIARARDALAGYSDEFLLDTFVFPGNSGGPVVTKPEMIAVQGTRPVSTSYLIGVIKSYVPYRDVAVSAQTRHARVVFEENSGLAAAVPIDFVERPFKDICIH